MAANNPIVQIIINLINGINHENNIYYEDGKKKYWLWNCRYLLNQVLRQYHVPDDHKFISKEAQKLFDSLNISDKKITDFHYQAKMYPGATASGILKAYKGNQKTSEEKAIIPNKPLVFREIFHEEHIICINDIIEELLNLSPLDENSVISLLDSRLYIAIITKGEDRDIDSVKHRSTNLDDVIKNVYEKEANISLIKVK